MTFRFISRHCFWILSLSSMYHMYGTVKEGHVSSLQWSVYCKKGNPRLSGSPSVMVGQSQSWVLLWVDGKEKVSFISKVVSSLRPELDRRGLLDFWGRPWSVRNNEKWHGCRCFLNFHYRHSSKRCRTQTVCLVHVLISTEVRSVPLILFDLNII